MRQVITVPTEAEWVAFRAYEKRITEMVAERFAWNRILAYKQEAQK